MSSATSKKRKVTIGTFGYYYHIGDKGVKLLGQHYPSRSDAIKSNTFKAAVREAILGTLVGEKADSVKVPSYQKVDVIRRGKYWYVVIVMQHISGQSARALGMQDDRDSATPSKEFLQLEKIVKKTSQQAKVSYYDCHTDNLIVGKDGTVYMIDFSPSYTRFKGSKEQWKKQVAKIMPQLTCDLNRRLSGEVKQALAKVQLYL